MMNKDEIKELYEEADLKVKEIKREFEKIGYNNLDYFQGRRYGCWLGERAILKRVLKEREATCD